MSHKIHIQFFILAVALSFGFAFTLPAFAHGDEASHANEVRKMKKLKTSSSTIEVRNGEKDRAGTSTDTKRGKEQKNVDASCMQTAVGTRESSLITAITAFNDSFEAGLATRKDALNSAWGLTVVSDRTTALGNAWKAWKTTQQTALKAFKEARKSAWDAFKGTVKTSCKVDLPKDEGLSKDESGSISI